ncbi:UNKNOWN [Stylonychia lemnae]|uniref:Uncharacterized protein n=1 Tax=Stylonychia lemnae TaxID=5949 RepID=A0A078A7F3_STYLE|nr:UNKNOWN [Stylonychia lemnae]|eukprot:CDW77801.1 UNKNOWN [Stylonychia lemnae]
MASKVRKGSSPIDLYQQQMLRASNQSPSSFNKKLNRGKTSSPGGVIKPGLQFNSQQNSINQQQQLNRNYQLDQQKKLSVDGFSDYSQSNLQQKHNSNSTKDNTKITIINAHNNSIASTIYNINGPYNSNITVNESKIKINDQYNSSVNEHHSAQQLINQNNQIHKPPMIPSLKAKIFQTAIGGAPTTSKSGNRTNALTGVTGLTFDDKIAHPTSSVLGDIHKGNFSRAGPGSISNLYVPSMGPLLTSPHYPEEVIFQSDIKSIVEFKRREEQMVEEFACSQCPYMHLNHSLMIDYQDRDNMKKRIVFSSLDELDRSVSDRNLMNIRDKHKQSFEDWQREISMKCQRNKQLQFQ